MFLLRLKRPLLGLAIVSALVLLGSVAATRSLGQTVPIPREPIPTMAPNRAPVSDGTGGQDTAPQHRHLPPVTKPVLPVPVSHGKYTISRTPVPVTPNPGHDIVSPKAPIKVLTPEVP